MKSMNKKTVRYLLCILIIALFSLAGYYFISSPIDLGKEDTWADSGFLKMGNNLTIKNADNTLTLLDSKDVLSANGLYYATWTMGEEVQLYFVLSEHKNATEADNDMTKWMDLAKSNYEVLTEEEVICNDQPYLLITYNCVNEDNPYDRGISAFGVHDKDTMCAELTCGQNFEGDLKAILINFLDNCTYGASPHLAR